MHKPISPATATAASSGRLTHLSPAKRALYEQMRARQATAAGCESIPHLDPAAPAPLSFAQQRLWFLDQLEPGNPFYNVAIAARLAGPLDADALRNAVRAVIARHDALRTTFRHVDGRPEQIIAAEIDFALIRCDLSSLDSAAREARLHELTTDEAVQPFDLAGGPLIRGRLIRRTHDEHVLLLTLHHIICDGWSMAVLQDEVAEHYAAIVGRRPPCLEPVPLQYTDFAAWQRQELTHPAADRHMQYWREALADLSGPLSLPLSRPRPAVQTYRGDVGRRTIDGALLARVRALAAESHGTLAMVLMAVFQVLLARLAGQRDLCVGTPIANRCRPELERLIGFFANTLVIRGRLDEKLSFREFLAQMRQTMLGAYAHQDMQFEQLVEHLRPERDLGRTPLVQVLFVLQNIPLRARQVADVTMTDASFDHAPIANFELTLNVDEHADRIDLSLVYNTDLFDAATIERWLDSYETLLAAAVATPDGRVLELPILSPAERHKLLVEWNATEASFPREQCIHDLIVAQARRTPDMAAVAFEGETLTYADLDSRSNRLARYLHQLGAGVDMPVGVCLGRSPELIIALLAILKAGAAYVPLDPDYPAARRAMMVDDARLSLVVTDSRLAARVLANDCRRILLDEEIAAIAACDDSAITAVARPESVAYMIYTSGSTGTPKGVEVEHRGLVNHAVELAQRYGLTPGDGLLQYLSLSFDAAAEEIFPALVAGATLHLHRSPAELSGRVLLDWSREHRVNVLHVPMPVLSSLVDEIVTGGMTAGAHLKAIGAGGDSLPTEQWRRFAAVTGGAIRFLFIYGVTEATITSTIFDGTRPPTVPLSNGLTIGRPIANTQLYVLDEFGQPAPTGVAGELYIGGVGVARGYRGRPELTAARFLADSFSGRDGARMYRTGDLVRYLSDGNIEFLGRVDRQVKVHGYRIEPAEIEAVLQLHPGVHEVIVVPFGAGEERRLAAYVGRVPGAGVTDDALRTFLAERLPRHMMPAAFTVMDHLPRLSCAKVDVAALPAPGWRRTTPDVNYVAPQGEIEQTLAAIWGEVLGIERVGANDNFFDLGGDSIRSIQVVARCGAAGLRITPKQLFAHQTIAALAQVVGSAPAICAPQGPVTGAVPLMPIQHEFFLLASDDPHHHNQAILLTVAPRVTTEIIEGASRQLVDYHDALRMRYSRSADGKWQQTIAPPHDVTILERFDLSHTTESKRASTIERIAADVQAGLDLEQGPLVRFVHFTLPAGEPARLLIVIHHLVVDAVSWRILLSDLNLLCGQLLAGRTLQLPPKTTPLGEWARRLVTLADTDETRSEAAYWTAPAATTALHRDVDGGPNVAGSTATVRFELDAETTRTLLGETAAAFRARPHELLIAALARVVADFTGRSSVRIDNEGHGREDLFDDVDLSRTVGWFTTLYPVTLRLPRERTSGAMVKAAKEQLRAIPGGGLRYGLLRWLSSDAATRDALGRMPQADVCFNFLGQLDGALPADALLGLAPESPGPMCSPHARRRHVWEIIAQVRDERLQVEWHYSLAYHTFATVERLADEYRQALRAMITASAGAETQAVTPTDFPLAGIDQQDLDALAKMLGQD